MSLNENQTKVLMYLARHPGEWMSPTDIGQDAGGKPYATASSWGSAAGKALTNLGYVERNRGKYRITDQGVNAADVLK